MKVISSTRDRILQPCTLDDLAGISYQIDPYDGCEHRCRYCYAQNQSGLDWDNEIGICPDICSRLAEEISPLRPQSIYIGMTTDPYQPAEKKYRHTRSILELLKERNFSVCILTKSSLVSRDIDLLRDMTGASAGISVTFPDDATRMLFEEDTLPGSDRMEAISELKKNGIESYGMICPVLPYITKVETLIEQLLPCVNTIWIYPLEMKSEEHRNWKAVWPIVQKHFPGIAGQFREIVFSADHQYWKELRQKLENLRDTQGINLKIRL
ncbi:MAG: radical SAM protein [Candidatus Xenobiia bacterium LiM19]